MTVFCSVFKSAILPAVAFLLLQAFGVPPPSAETIEDPFARATTPPEAFHLFNKDFSSLNLGFFLTWIHPERGLVKNGILLTREEAQEEFGRGFGGELVSETGELVGLNVQFNYGEFVGASCYQADCWVEYVVEEGGEEGIYRFHNVFVFEVMESGWYLVQTEYIPSEPGVLIDFESPVTGAEEIHPGDERFAAPYSEPGLMGVINWPLLLGTSFMEEIQLHPVRGTTMGGKTWTLEHAVGLGKPTVMYFFSVHGLSVALPEDFEAQMKFLAGLYDEFGREDLFIFGVTDDAKEDVIWLGESGYNEFAPLLDEGSRLHAALNIDVHPYIVVFDSLGTVVGVSKTFHPSSFPIVKGRIREAIARARAAENQSEE